MVLFPFIETKILCSDMGLRKIDNSYQQVVSQKSSEKLNRKVNYDRLNILALPKKMNCSRHKNADHRPIKQTFMKKSIIKTTIRSTTFHSKSEKNFSRDRKIIAVQSLESCCDNNCWPNVTKNLKRTKSEEHCKTSDKSFYERCREAKNENRCFNGSNEGLTIEATNTNRQQSYGKSVDNGSKVDLLQTLLLEIMQKRSNLCTVDDAVETNTDRNLVDCSNDRNEKMEREAAMAEDDGDESDSSYYSIDTAPEGKVPEEVTAEKEVQEEVLTEREVSEEVLTEREVSEDVMTLREVPDEITADGDEPTDVSGSSGLRNNSSVVPAQLPSPTERPEVVSPETVNADHNRLSTGDHDRVDPDSDFTWAMFARRPAENGDGQDTSDTRRDVLDVAVRSPPPAPVQRHHDRSTDDGLSRCPHLLSGQLPGRWTVVGVGIGVAAIVGLHYFLLSSENPCMLLE